MALEKNVEKYFVAGAFFSKRIYNTKINEQIQ